MLCTRATSTAYVSAGAERNDTGCDAACAARSNRLLSAKNGSVARAVESRYSAQMSSRRDTSMDSLPNLISRPFSIALLRDLLLRPARR
jgi:hypothetical protein